MTSKPSRRTFVKAGGATVGLSLVSIGAPFVKRARSQDVTLNWLTQPGHGHESIIGPFRERTGIDVTVKEAGSGDLQLVEVTQNPGLFDVVTASMEFLPQFVAAEAFETMDPEKYSGWEDYLPEFKKDIGYNVGGEFHTIIYAFGYNALAYRSDLLSEEDVTSYEILLDPRLDGKVGIQDWWGNAMGVLSIAAGFSPSEGRNPYIISDSEFAQLREYMMELRPRVAGFFEIAGIFSAFANGTISAQPGGGDWSAQLLQDQGVPVAASVPKEGGYLWGEAISIAAGTEKRDAAEKFVDYILSAEAQMRIATKPSYSSIVPNGKAWELMQSENPEWARRLQMDSFKDPNALSPFRDGRIAVRYLPQEQTVDEWATLFQEFKNA